MGLKMASAHLEAPMATPRTMPSTVATEKPNQHPAQAHQQVPGDDMAADGLKEGGKEELNHLQRAGGGLLGGGEGGDKPPEYEEAGDGQHGVGHLLHVEFLFHPRRPPFTNLRSRALRPTVKMVADEADGEHGHHDEVGPGQGAVDLDHVAQALVGGQHLGGAEGHPGGAQEMRRPVKIRGRGGGDGYGEEHLLPGGPEGLGHPEVDGLVCLMPA